MLLTLSSRFMDKEWTPEWKTSLFLWVSLFLALALELTACLDTYAKHDDLKSAIKEYGIFRPKDAHAIADLAMYNYIEMRDLVTRYSTFL